MTYIDNNSDCLKLYKNGVEIGSDTNSVTIKTPTSHQTTAILSSVVIVNAIATEDVMNVNVSCTISDDLIFINGFEAVE